MVFLFYAFLYTMSKRKHRIYPKFVKRRMIEDDTCSESMMVAYVFVMLMASMTTCLYLYICLAKLA
jgi:hypothetical protein